MKQSRPLASGTLKFATTCCMFLWLFLLSGCTLDDPSSDNNKSQKIGTIKAPAAIQIELLPPGELTASFKIDEGVFTPMQLDGTQAALFIDELTPGEHTFTIRWEYNSDDFGLVLLAEATKTITLAEGENVLAFVDGDYNTSAVDADDDGLSNLVELESGTNPFDGVCIFDVSLFDACNFVNS